MNGDNKEWRDWANHVLTELKRFDSDMQGLNRGINKIRIEIATLKVKSGIWGMIGAMIPIGFMFLANYLSK